MNLNEEQILKKLQEKAKELLDQTQDSLRRQDIKNIQNAIHEALSGEASEKFIQKVCERMAKRIQHLMDNPDSAGEHEKYRT